jgi:hypothetical protein
MSSFSRDSLSFGSSGLKWPRRSMKRPSRGKARVGDDDVIDRTLLGACASEADND